MNTRPPQPQTPMCAPTVTGLSVYPKLLPTDRRLSARNPRSPARHLTSSPNVVPLLLYTHLYRVCRNRWVPFSTSTRTEISFWFQQHQTKQDRQRKVLICTSTPICALSSKQHRPTREIYSITFAELPPDRSLPGEGGGGSGGVQGKSSLAEAYSRRLVRTG